MNEGRLRHGAILQQFLRQGSTGRSEPQLALTVGYVPVLGREQGNRSRL
jgi:hypothetical protein